MFSARLGQPYHHRHAVETRRWMAVRVPCRRLVAPAIARRRSWRLPSAHDLVRAMSFGRKQDDLRSPDVLLQRVAILRNCFQPLAVKGGHHDRYSRARAIDSQATHPRGIFLRIQMSDVIHWCEECGLARCDVKATDAGCSSPRPCRASKVRQEPAVAAQGIGQNPSSVHSG